MTREQPSTRLGWSGSLVLLVVVYAPVFLAPLLFPFGSPAASLARGLALLPGLALVALLAPIAGYRRSNAWAMVVPIWGQGRIAEIGYDLALIPARRDLRSPEIERVYRPAC